MSQDASTAARRGTTTHSVDSVLPSLRRHLECSPLPGPTFITTVIDTFQTEELTDAASLRAVDMGVLRALFRSVPMGRLVVLKDAVADFAATTSQASAITRAVSGGALPMSSDVSGAAAAAAGASVPVPPSAGGRDIAVGAAVGAGIGDGSDGGSDSDSDGDGDTDADADGAALAALRAAHPDFPFVSAPDGSGMRWFYATCMRDLPGADGSCSRLFQWAYKDGWQAALRDLVKAEDWGRRHHALTHYIQHTFARLLHEGQVLVRGRGPGHADAAMVVFNTGLLTRANPATGVLGGDVVIAVLTPRPAGARDGQLWGFMLSPASGGAPAATPPTHGVFVTEDDVVSKDRFRGCPPPAMACYARHRHDLVWDVGVDPRSLRVDVNHLLDTHGDHFSRLPAQYHDRPRAEVAAMVRGACRAALEEVRTNVFAAVPQYYRGSVQLLLPLYLSNADVADLALVLRRDVDAAGDTHYTVKTWLHLSWAYHNARLIAPVHQPWLRRGLSSATTRAPADFLAGVGAGAGGSAGVHHRHPLPTQVAVSAPVALPASAAPRRMAPPVAPSSSVSGPVASGSRADRADRTGRRDCLLPEDSPGFPSVCVPHVLPAVTEAEIRDVFERECGAVARVDMVPKADHTVVFVHFAAWHPHARGIRDRLVAGVHALSGEKLTVPNPRDPTKVWKFAASRVPPPKL